jgi:hypothetical protein
MKALANFEILFGLLLLIFQFIVLTLIFILALRKSGLLKFPIAGLEYSQGIFVSLLLVGGYIIGLSSIIYVFETVKSIQNAGQPVYITTFVKFSQFFLVILLLEILYWLLVLFSAKLLFGLKNAFQEIITGNIPASCFVGSIALGYSLLMYFSARELFELITPKFFVIN